MNFLEKAKAQLEYMRRINTQVKNNITAMPEGSLVHKFAKGHTYYYEAIMESSLVCRTIPGFASF